MLRASHLYLWFVPLLVLMQSEVRALQPPEAVGNLLQKYCCDCHADGAQEGGFHFEVERLDWSEPSTVVEWEAAYERVSRGIMPPPDAEQLPEDDRRLLMRWLDESLIAHGPVGGTTPRRLNRREYANTVSRIFGIANYKVPDSFPPDNLANGFDNQGEALVMAGAHLEAFAEAATDIADQVFPPESPPAETRVVEVLPNELVISYSSACLIDGAMRLASSGSNFRRHATWPTRFEAHTSGVYQVQVDVSAFGEFSHTPLLDISVMPVSNTRGKVEFREAVAVDHSKPRTATVEIEMHKGDTVLFRYSNGPFDYDNATEYSEFLKKLFTNEPRLAAAWEKVGNPPRGGSGWARVKAALAELDPHASQLKGEDELQKLVRKVASNKVGTGETLVYKYFEEGPGLAIHKVRIAGPISAIRDRRQIQADRLRENLVGDTFDSKDPRSLNTFFERFLSSIFRRPAKPSEVDGYVELVQNEIRATGSPDLGMHLALRTALISPSFLYRNIGSGELNDYELATRVSYFTKSAPATGTLLKLASTSQLRDSDALGMEACKTVTKQFAEDFTTQWLGLGSVSTLMPDARLGQFNDRHRKTVLSEVTETYWHIWSNNLSVTEFIAPDFVFTDAEVGWDIYALKEFRPSKASRKDKARRNKLRLVEVPRFGRHGGLLSMSAVMMATANGVDTQPVLRGVWTLNNILGMPPPEPPDSVPALTPDTSQATSVRERLASHMTEESCAVCHREIDPLGFALENFDPVGRWRTTYPDFRDRPGNGPAQPVDATGVLPDRTPLSDVTDLKHWLADHPEYFARCFSEKLMTYATGRRLSHRERRIIADIVRTQKKDGYRIQSLLKALVNSTVFRSR